MTRAWNTPVFAIAIVYFSIDGIFSYITQPLTAWLSKKKLLERGAALGYVPGAVPVVSPLCSAVDHPGTSEAPERLPDRDGAFLRRSVRLYCSGGSKAHCRRAAVSIEQEEAANDSGLRVGLWVLAAND
jgi:hypothetical protein